MKSGIILVFILVVLISGCVTTPKTDAKDVALEDCISRASECALGVSAFEYELKSQCNNIYRTANTPEEISNLARNFC